MCSPEGFLPVILMPGVLLLDLFLGQTFTCNNFFHKAMEPMGLIPPKAAQICQTYTNRIYFATIYDQEHRIPISSAYLYNKGGKNCGSDSWFLEAMNLKSDCNESNCLSLECHTPLSKQKKSQAVSEDDKNIYHYDQGHLSPCMHHTDEGKKIAMFTLTNVVPEFKELKNKEWSHYENQEMEKFEKGCYKTHVIVGVVRGENIKKK
uniref:DNA/RNA non-specific endonuclease/pyrophosphatase/phosphodiesterase domain-containing protein n=1 Tax=Erpetoichthys calabaricus TaxID=27687 RepID=A0A8C4TA48_ERPCA